MTAETRTQGRWYQSIRSHHAITTGSKMSDPTRPRKRVKSTGGTPDIVGFWLGGLVAKRSDPYAPRVT